MLASIEVDDDDGWQVYGKYILFSAVSTLNRALSQRSPRWSPQQQPYPVCYRQVHETTPKPNQSTLGEKDWSKEGEMGFPGSMDLYARTGLRPICDLVPAGSGVTARPDPPFTGGDGPAGCDHTAMSPPSKNGDGMMPFLSNRPDGIPDCYLSSGNTLGGGVLFAGAAGAVVATETTGKFSSSNLSLPGLFSSSRLCSWTNKAFDHCG